MKMQEIKLNVFETQLFIFWDCTLLDVKNYIDKKYTGFPEHLLNWLSEKENNENPPQGVCLSDPGKSPNCIIWLSKSPDKDIGNFTHEVAHACYRIMAHWHIALDENSQEILAMLVGNITNQVLPLRKKNK